MRGHRHTKQRPWHQSERLLGGSARDACCWLCVCWFCRGSHPTPPRRPPHPSPKLRQHPSPDRPARVAAGASWVRGTRSNSCGTATPNHWPQPLASFSHLRMRAVPRPCSIWPLSRPAPPLPSSPASPPLHPAVPACRCFGGVRGCKPAEGAACVVHVDEHLWSPACRRRDCHSAAPPSPFSRCFNGDGERASAEGQSRRRLARPLGHSHGCLYWEGRHRHRPATGVSRQHDCLCVGVPVVGTRSP